MHELKTLRSTGTWDRTYFFMLGSADPADRRYCVGMTDGQTDRHNNGGLGLLETN